MKLLSIGEILWDVYSDGQTLGGATLNLAAHYAILGGEASLATAIGNDELGFAARAEAERLGVDTTYVSVNNEKLTGQTLVTLNKKGIPSYNILTDVAYDYIKLPNVLEEKFDIVAFGTLALREKHNREMLTELLAHNSFTEVYTDLNIRAPFYSKESIDFCLSHATIAKISDEEMPTVCKTLFGKEWDPVSSAKKIAEAYPTIKLLLITKGADGSFCYDTKDGKIYDSPAQKADVVSSVGAGDSFGGAFVYNYMNTANIESSLLLASKLSAYVVSNQAAVPEGTRDFLKSIL